MTVEREEGGVEQEMGELENVIIGGGRKILFLQWEHE